MVKLELYIREITRFLRTVTLKNKYFADQMLETWVKPEYRSELAIEDQPYYKHLSGQYILSDNSFETARKKLELPTEYRCYEIQDILHKPTKYSSAEYSKALNEFNRIRNLVGYPNLDVGSLDAAVVDYMKSFYGLAKSVRVNGVLRRTDDVYSKFDNVPIINSFDTKQPVPFTFKLINSIQHRKTRATYKIPSSYYDKLIEEYPNEKDIIKNILYPIKCKTIQEAYNADNYSILGYDLSLLEEDERTSLFNAMEEKLNVIRRRWDVGAFVYENLYALSMQAKIWSILLAELFKQRIINIRTSEVHSYHLWNYLISKGVGDYSDVLTRKQALFLYKNWPWIYRHKGSDHNLLLLTHKLLYEHHLTVHDKIMLQDTETLHGEEED